MLEDFHGDASNHAPVSCVFLLKEQFVFAAVSYLTVILSFEICSSFDIV